MNTKAIGDRGEKLARRYLWFHGYRVIEKNYRARHGEIDIIAVKGRYIVFVEVKTRNEANVARFGRPARAVNYEKRQHIRYSVSEYLRGRNIKKQPRIDIIEVYLSGRKHRIEHIVNAFGGRG